MKRDDIETLVRDPRHAGNAETAARVYADASLWPVFEDALYPDADVTDAERAVIRRVVAERCGGAQARRAAWLKSFVASRLERISGGLGDFALAAASRTGCEAGAAGGGEQTGAAKPDDPVTFVFVSEPADELDAPRPSWRAEMTLPADAAVDTMLPIAVTDRAGAAVGAGVFKVAGVALPIQGGRAEIPYGMFLTGLRDAQVELITPEGVRSPGTLALF